MFSRWGGGWRVVTLLLPLGVPRACMVPGAARSSGRRTQVHRTDLVAVTVLFPCKGALPAPGRQRGGFTGERGLGVSGPGSDSGSFLPSDTLGRWGLTFEPQFPAWCPLRLAVRTGRAQPGPQAGVTDTDRDRALEVGLKESGLLLGFYLPTKSH